MLFLSKVSYQPLFQASSDEALKDLILSDTRDTIKQQWNDPVISQSHWNHLDSQRNYSTSNQRPHYRRVSLVLDPWSLLIPWDVAYLQMEGGSSSIRDPSNSAYCWKQLLIAFTLVLHATFIPIGQAHCNATFADNRSPGPLRFMPPS